MGTTANNESITTELRRHQSILFTWRFKVIMAVSVT